ncbi:MAG: MarR family winged helix-turn-helix transcriptional regulator [Lachnospiraceae bacterium]|jgi:DNA-binding MarR family transcriptional regulator
MDTDEALKLKNQLCFPLYAAARKITSAYTPILKPLGLTYTQYLVFLVLWEQDGISMGQLGKKLRLDSGTLTPLVKKMERSGYLIRRRSSQDERSVDLFLTDSGKAVKEKVRDVPAKMRCEVSALTDRDMLELYRLLYKFLDN